MPQAQNLLFGGRYSGPCGVSKTPGLTCHSTGGNWPGPVLGAGQIPRLAPVPLCPQPQACPSIPSRLKPPVPPSASSTPSPHLLQ